MKLVKKIVSRATENTLLQIETISQLSSVLGISLGVIAVILESKGNEKLWSLIFISLMLGFLILVLYLRVMFFHIESFQSRLSSLIYFP